MLKAVLFLIFLSHGSINKTMLLLDTYLQINSNLIYQP